MSLTLRILVPDATILETTVEGVQAADASGSFVLRTGHQNFCTVLVPCVLTYRDADGREGFAGVDGGILLLEHDVVTIVTRSAAAATDLNQVVGAVEAMLQARRSTERSAQENFDALVASLVKRLPDYVSEQ